MALSGEFGTSNQYIKYYFEMIQNSQNIGGNSSNVTVRVWVKRTNSYTTYGTGSVSVSINGGAYSAGISSSQKITTTPIILFERTLDVTHNGDGTGRVDVYASISHQEFSAPTNGWGFGLTTIPRATVPTLNVSTQNMGSVIAISTPRADASFTHTLTVIFGSQTFNIAFDVATSFNWTLPLTLANEIPNATAGIGSIVCSTYSGGALIGQQSVGFTAVIPSSMVPSFTAVTHSENVADVATKAGVYVQNMTKLNLDITGAAGTYNSTISKFEITVDGVTYGKASVSNTIKTSGTLTITGKITDSRGQTATKTVNITVTAYEPPKITDFTIVRCNSDGTLNEMGTYAKVTRKGNWSVIGTKNTMSIVIKSKARGASTWTTKNTYAAGTSGAVNNTIVLSTYAATSSHDFMIEYTDLFNTTISLSVLSTGQVTMSWGKTGIAIGKVWEAGALDLAGDLNISGGHINLGTGQMKGRLGGERIPASSDLNNYTTEGLYYASLNADVQTMTNCPTGQAFSLLVERTAGAKQTLSSYVTTGWVTWQRNMYNNAWGKWRRIGNEAALAFSAKGSGQVLNANTNYRAIWTVERNDAGIFGFNGAPANMWQVPEEGWYLMTYSVRINQSINTRFKCELWGNPNEPIEILNALCTNNGWNYLFGSNIAYCYPARNYEYVLNHEDGTYSRTVDAQRVTFTRIH